MLENLSTWVVHLPCESCEILVLVGIAIPTHRHLSVFGVLETCTIFSEIAIRDNVVLVVIVESIIAGVDKVGHFHLREIVVILYFINLNIRCTQILQSRFLGYRDNISKYIWVEISQLCAIHFDTRQRILRIRVELRRDGIDLVSLSGVVRFDGDGGGLGYTAVNDSYRLLRVLLDNREMYLRSAIG